MTDEEYLACIRGNLEEWGTYGGGLRTLPMFDAIVFLLHRLDLAEKEIEELQDELYYTGLPEMDEAR